jgi:homoserine O-succinyltransferase
LALIIPSNYHKISDVEKNHISWIEPELAKRQDIRPLRIGILNIMPLGKQYEFN